MLKGSGKPKIIVGGVLFDLPEPARGGRHENQKDLTKKFDNVLYMKRRSKRQKYRFEAEYRFIKFTDDNYRTLNKALNANGQRCVLIPYGDKGVQKFTGYAHLEQINQKGYVDTKSIKLFFIQAGVSSSRVDSERFIGGSLQSNKAVVLQIFVVDNAGEYVVNNAGERILK